MYFRWWCEKALFQVTVIIFCSFVIGILLYRFFVLGNKKFTVRNSNDLILYSNAFKKAEINGKFFGVADLRIEEKAFNSADAKVSGFKERNFNLCLIHR